MCLLEALNQKEKRLGTLWVSTQRAAMKSRDFLMERILLEVEGKLEEKINVGRLRQDQVLMYALLGDPATRLHLPDKLNAEIKRLSDGWHWKADKPRGATGLQVSFCAAGQNLPTVQLPLEKTAALKRFEEANATFAFAALNELDIKQPWEGPIDKEGTLRLVALGPGLFRTAAFRLKHIPCPGHDIKIRAIGDDQHGFQLLEVFVSAPVLCKLDRGALQLTRRRLELGFKTLEKRKGVGG